MKNQLEAAKRAEARANQAYKKLAEEYKESQRQLKDVNKKNVAQKAQKTLDASPAQEYAKLQQKTCEAWSW